MTESIDAKVARLMDMHRAAVDPADRWRFDYNKGASDALEAALRTELASSSQPAYDKLFQIIAATYQIAGFYDAPEHVLDVLANPELATQEQIDALLPFDQPAA